MSRLFAYCRVSTENQNTANQVLEIQSAGFTIASHRVIEEKVSGSVEARQRSGWIKLIERLESGDIVVVTKLDRLGRNAMDVRLTVEDLTARGIRVHCLALGGVDLTSPAGKMTMQVLSAVAEFERDLLVERTQSGLARAKAEGKKLGRPEAIKTRTNIHELKSQRFTQLQVATKLELGIATVKRHWNQDLIRRTE